MIYIVVKTEGGRHALAARRVHPDRNAKIVQCINSWGPAGVNYKCKEDNLAKFFVVDVIVTQAFDDRGRVPIPSCNEGAQERIDGLLKTADSFRGGGSEGGGMHVTNIERARALVEEVTTGPRKSQGTVLKDLSLKKARKLLEAALKECKKSSPERMTVRIEISKVDLERAKLADLSTALDILRKSYLILRRVEDRTKRGGGISQSVRRELASLIKARTEIGEQITSAAKKSLEELKASLKSSEKDDIKLIRLIQGLGNQLPEGLLFQPECYFEAADAFFKMAIKAKDKDDVKIFDYTMQEVANLLPLAQRTLDSIPQFDLSRFAIKMKFRDLSEQCIIERRSAKLHRAINDVLKYMGEDEGKSQTPEQRLALIDKLHIAVQQCQGKDTIAECKAYVYMAVLWWNQDENEKEFSHNKGTANGLCHTAIKMEATTRPKVSTMSSWYQRCQALILKFQNLIKTMNDETGKPEYQEAIAALEKELDDVKAAAEGWVPKLIEHIYKVHPPKKVKTSKFPSFPISDDKAVFRPILEKAMARYRPDKRCNKARDSPDAPLDKERYKWHVLCVEITKYLNAAHTRAFYPCAS